MSTIQKRLFFISFLVAIVIFLTHFFHVKTAVYGDGRYYYSYLPSLLIEHTFNFSKAFHQYGLSLITTPTHFLQNPHTIGPAVFWIIPYMLGYFVFGNHNPYNVLLQIPVGIWNVSLVFLGLFFLYLSLKKFFSQHIAFLTTLTIFFATNLIFYGAVDVINSHSGSFFFASVFVYLWLSKVSLKNSVLMGISLGMLTLIRNQDIIFALLPLSSFLNNITKSAQFVSVKNSLLMLILIITETLIILLPQFFLWHILWGGWLKSPYLYGATFSFFHPNIFGVLFNSYDGLFLWTPISLIAVYGLCIFSREQPQIGLPFLLIFLSTLYLISAFEIWWGGASFSARYFITTLPLLAFGLANFYKKYLSEKKQWIFSILFSMLNLVLILLFLMKK